MPDAAGMGQLRVDTRSVTAEVWELAIAGSLDWSNFSKVEAAIDEIFRRGVYRIVVNLREARYISSAGFGCIISSLDTAMKNDGDLIFASTPPEIQDVFNILGLSKILRFADDPAQAAAQLKR